MTDIEMMDVLLSRDGNQAHYVASDPKATYCLVKPGVDLQAYNPAFTEWVPGARADYSLMPPGGLREHFAKSVVSTQGLPMSFLQVETVEEGFAWYTANTKYPAEVCQMLAKYEWGDLRYTTPKEFRNQKKRNKKKKEKQQGMTIRRSDPILLHFD